MDTKALHEGYLLKNSEYRIISLLGQGGFGITYLAEQLSLSRKVAIKEFFMKENCNRDENTSEVSVPSVGSRELVAKFRQKFLREARMIAKLDNPHIVKIYDVFEENGTAYYVMEYLDGGSFVDRGPMSESKALDYIRQVASALDYLHGKNILHFDIKPANILIGNAGQAMLIDFGISKHYDVGGGQTSSTPVGISNGYAPLEQYQQGEISTFTPATDIYALGATLYYLLLGQTPPNASEIYEEGIVALPSHLSASVRKAIEKAMSPRRKDRPQSVQEFLSLLDGGRPVASEVPVADEETQMDSVVESSSASPSVLRRKSRWLLWLTLCLLVFFGGMFTIFVALPYFCQSILLKDTFVLGLKGNVETVKETSDYYEITGNSKNLVLSSVQESGLYDGNAFLSVVFGDEHGARIPFNYLLIYSTNITFRFNDVGNIESLTSNAEQGGFISFYYDEKNNLIKQDASNNVHKNQDEGIIQYNGSQMIYEGRTYSREELSDREFILTKDSVSFGSISLDENHRVRRIYFPNYWAKNYAEYLFEYNSYGWPSKIMSRTGKKGRGQIITTFSYLATDDSENWIERIALVDYRYGDERQQIEIKTSRSISYR